MILFKKDKLFYKKVLLILTILFISERLYLIPINVSLDMKPDGTRSATYLAMTIARVAGCTVSIWDTVDGTKSKIHSFPCRMEEQDSSFRIIIFENKDLKYKHSNYNIKEKEYIENLHSRQGNNQERPDIHSPCFKSGEYYTICENPGWEWENDNYTIKLNGEKFYHQFPGEDINY